MMIESSDEDCNITSLEEEEQVCIITELDFLRKKTREKYLKAFESFNDWRVANGATTFSDTVMLTYFMELAKTRQPATLWSIYSMLKVTIKTKCDVHIETFAKLMEFLRKKSIGHKSKKSKVFTVHNIEKFLKEAPDYNFLATKVALIIGISGACRTTELSNLTVDNIEKHSEKLLLVNLRNTKIDRSFVIREEYVNIVEKYKALRPPNTKIDRFFLQYRNEKCSRQPMGVNKIGGMPRNIATFLKLEGPRDFTGHCFRRTSATLLDDAGADLTMLKFKGHCKSSAVTEEYIQDSIESEASPRKILKKTSMTSIFPCTKIKPVDPLAQQLCSETFDQQFPATSDVQTQIKHEVDVELSNKQFSVKKEIEIPIPVEQSGGHQYTVKSVGSQENLEQINGSIQRYEDKYSALNIRPPIEQQNDLSTTSTPIKQEPIPQQTKFEFITAGISSPAIQEPTSQGATEVSAKNNSMASKKPIQWDAYTKLTAREKELILELNRMRLLAASRKRKISTLRSKCFRLQIKNSDLTTIIKKLKSNQNG